MRLSLYILLFMKVRYAFLPIKIYTMLTNLDDRQHAAYLYRPGTTATWSKAQVYTYVLSGVQCTSCRQRSSPWKDN